MQNVHPDSMTAATSVPFPGFEGPEKKLEIDFRFNDVLQQKSKGFRSLSKEEWQTRVCDKAKCTIVSVTSNKYFDSYVLSESSLFVYPTKVMIKTCGTTTLLNAVEPLMEIAKELNMSVLHVVFSRKNFNFPEVQPAPHRSFAEECKLLDKYFDGNQYIIGPMNQDHWNLYVADYHRAEDNAAKAEATIEVMMHDLCPKKMKQFFKDPATYKDAMDVTEKSGISGLLPGSIIDALQFDPCGYSCNGLLGEAYWTIHITPEAHCSYVSFETNVSPSTYNKKTASEFYSWLLANVAKVFKPGRMTVTLFADDHVPQMCQLRKSSSCFDDAIRKLSSRYALKSKSMYEFEGSSVTLCNLSKTPKKVEKKPKHPTMTLQTIAKELGITIDDAPKEKSKLKKKEKATIATTQSFAQVIGH